MSNNNYQLATQRAVSSCSLAAQLSLPLLLSTGTNLLVQLNYQLPASPSSQPIQFNLSPSPPPPPLSSSLSPPPSLPPTPICSSPPAGILYLPPSPSRRKSLTCSHVQCKCWSSIVTHNTGYHFTAPTHRARWRPLSHCKWFLSCRGRGELYIIQYNTTVD